MSKRASKTAFHADGRGLVRQKATDRLEVESRKNDVEMLQPPGTPGSAGRVEVDLLGDHEVEVVKPLQAVIHGE